MLNGKSTSFAGAFCKTKRFRMAKKSFPFFSRAPSGSAKAKLPLLLTLLTYIPVGKAGIPVELGLWVAIVEDQHRFILHPQVMEKTTDDQIAVPLVAHTQTRFPTVKAMSFGKGFHSPGNQTKLKQCLENVIWSKKGRLSEADKARESDPEFVRLRRQHSAVESTINALGVHGLDKCPDHGIDGFKRYVALAIVARNIQRLGAMLREQEQQEANRRRGPYKKAA